MFDKHLWQAGGKFRIWLGGSVLFGGLSGIVTVGQAWIMSGIIDAVFLGGGRLAEVGGQLRSLLFLILARGVLVWLGDLSGGVGAARIKADLRERLFAHLMKVGPYRNLREGAGSSATAIMEGGDSLDAYFKRYIPQIALAALIPLTILYFLFPVDILSGSILLVTAPLIPLFMYLIGDMADKKTQEQYKLLSRLSSHYLDIIQGLKTLKVLGRSKEQGEAIRETSEKYADITLEVLKIAFLSALTLELLSTLSTAIVAVEIGLRLLKGGIDFRHALFILILAPEFYMPLRKLGLYFHDGMAGIAAAEKIYSLMALPTSAATKGIVERDFIEKIEFRDVKFSYEEGREKSLEGVSFQIERGQKAALVGVSGAGKTTIVNLLMRFAAPESGEILVDGVDLQSLDVDVWRNQTAFVSQSPMIFYGTLGDNLRFGKPEASEEELNEAIEKARLGSFVDSLPDGVDTGIGERGFRLSGGQAQRLAVARAILKDAPFMILDEPTANLDPKNEKELQASLKALMKGRTVLVVAHRLTTVLDADKIFVVNEGRIVERGKHAELLQIGGVYAGLVGAYVGGGD